MIYIILTITALLIINIGLGNLYQKIFGLKRKIISIDIIFGIIPTTFLLTVFAFWFPINQYFEIAFSLIGIISFIYFKSYVDAYSFLKDRGPFFYILLLIICFAATFSPFIYDHFGYYVPSIKWIAEYGLVNGISNLDLSLGQASFWHIYQTAFSHYIDPFLKINAFVLVLFVIYSFETRRWILLTFVPIFLLFIQSPSPDLVVFCLSLIAVNELLNYQKNGKFIFALSVFIFIIKPTMLWLPLFSGLYYLWIKGKNINFIIYGCILLALYLVKNIWLFGFPIFPVSVLDFNLAWTPNADILEKSSHIGTLTTFDFQYSLEEIKQFTLFDFIKNWLTLEGIKSKINILFIISLLGLLVFCIIKNKRIYYLLFATIIIKSILVVAFSGQYRFFLDVIFIVIFLVFYKTWYAFSKLSTITLSLIVITLLSFPEQIKTQIPSFKVGHFFTGFNKTQIIKPNYFELNKYNQYKIGNLQFNIVDNYPFSFDTPLPAVTPAELKYFYKAGIFPQLKTTKTKDGFIWKKLNNAEKSQLLSIINKK